MPAESYGQTLHLSSAASEPPAIAESSYASSQVGSLENEIAALIAAQHGADATRDLVLRTSINVRILAADMLAAGDAAVPARAGSPLILAGLTLVAGCADIDQSLEKLVALRQRAAASPDALEERDGRLFRIATTALKQFNDLAVQRAQDVKQHDAAKFDAAISAIVTPLSEAIATLDQASIANHWIDSPHTATVGSDFVPDMPSDPKASIQDLLERCKTAPLSDAARAAILNAFNAGGSVELQLSIEATRKVMLNALNFADALDEGMWFSAADRAMYMQRLEQALLLFGDPATRDRGERRLARLAASSDIMHVITELSRRGMDIAPLRNAMLIADALIDNPRDAQRGELLLERLGRIAQRMLAYRLTDSAAPPASDLAPIRRELEKSYQQAEQSLLAEIAEVAADDQALSRPQFSSLVMNHQQYLDDLQRLERVPRWLEIARLIRPQASSALANQLRRLCQWLLDANRRPDAVLALDQLEQQFELFYPLPLESELRAGGGFVVEVSGAQNQALARAIDEQRQRWIFGLSRGEGSGVDANRMLLLYRLMRTMSDLQAISAMDASGSLLNRWSAWELSGDVVARAAADLPTRMKLAVAAAVETDDDALREQLDRIDDSAPLVRLAGRFRSLGADALAALPDGAAGFCGQIVSMPGEDAWVIDHRIALANLCRYAAELEYARMRGDGPLVESLTDYVNGIAGELLDQLGDYRDPLPTIAGFHGNDNSAPQPDRREP